MTTIKIKVAGTAIAADVSGDLTTGMVGAAYEAEYDSAWDGLGKLVVFRAGNEKIIALDGKVPHVLLTKENVMLQVGVEGRDQEGHIVLPTIWTDVGYVVPGARGEEGPDVEPDNPVWKQSAALAREALDKANSLQQRADSGEFQGPPGPQGPGYEHSEEFYQLAVNVRENKETAENAATLSGLNASRAAASAAAAGTSEAGVKADADSAAQAAAAASHHALTVRNALIAAEAAEANAEKAGTQARQAAELAQAEAQKASQASDTAKKEADRSEKNASINEGFLASPPLRNGSIGNPGNADAVATDLVIPTHGVEAFLVRTNIQAAPGNSYLWTYRCYARDCGKTSDPDGVTNEVEVRTTRNWVRIPTMGRSGIGVSLIEKKPDGGAVPHRIEDQESAISLLYDYLGDRAAGKNHGLVTVSPYAEITVTPSKTAGNMLMTFIVKNSDAEFCLNPGSYISFSAVHSQLPSRTELTVSGNMTTFTIIMSVNDTLLFDAVNRTFRIAANVKFPVDEACIVCLQSRENTSDNSNGNFVGGTLYNQYVGNLARKHGHHPAIPDYTRQIRKFSELFAHSSNIDSFLFFTDPHYMGFADYERICVNSLNKMKAVCDLAPVSYCVCGGDWLQSGDTPQQAAGKLSLADSYARACFRDYVPVAGNHDTNYLGTERLTDAALRNLMFRQEQRAYYAHKSPTTTAYVFDSGLDWPVAMDEYRWKQIDWFAKSLEADDPAHSYVALHIGLDEAAKTSLPLTDNIIQIINAYNGRKSIKLNGISYQFSEKTGTCHYIMAGHNHVDYSTTVNGVPVILSEAVILTDNDPQPHAAFHEDAFTLCLADYDSHVLHCIRCGFGEDRIIQIIPTVV